MNYANPQYLVEAEWLNTHIGDDNIRIFDVTGMLTSKLQNLAGERHYEQGHIPGAMFMDVASAKGTLSNTEASLPWMWPSVEQFQTAMSEHGVNQKVHVIVYAATPRPGVDNGTMWSTRAWWTLHHMGVRCSILNGGWEKWIADGYAVSQTMSSYAPMQFQAATPGREAIVERSQVLSALESTANTVVVDALSAESFSGRDKPRYGSRKGHITGAVSIPMSEMLDADTGTFLKAEEMAVRLEKHGLLSANRVISYCGGGIAATVDAFCLALLGHENVAVYDGSLLDWLQDDAHPMTDPSL
jgi:thiosulfate/3-mercaptopyruvate sulfurtransferase